MKIRNDYGRYDYPRSPRVHKCRLCGWQILVLQWDFLPNYRYDVCCDCARDRWENELKGLTWNSGLH